MARKHCDILINNSIQNLKGLERSAYAYLY